MSLEELKGIRDFAILYNRVVETCFDKCIFTFNYRYLVDDEIQCINNCAQRMTLYNNRLGLNFSETQLKKMQDLQNTYEADQQKQLQEQQQQQQQIPQQTQEQPK